MIVTKFGGSSLADSTQFKKVKDIILANEKRTVVVVSAPGKRNSGDNKITDLLYTLNVHLKYGVNEDGIWETIASRYREIKESLNIPYDIDEDLNKIKSEFSNTIDNNYLISRGEYLCAKLMAAYLGYAFVDSKDIICFTYEGTLDEKLTGERIREAYEKHGKIVVPGFYGSYPNGDIKLLARGGSDITGSYLARFLCAEIYENWTDVTGIYSADPRIVKNPKPIPQITYSELRELSYMGANVLHEDSILPVQDLDIAINILNTNEPESAGTIIKSTCDTNEPIITGMAGKKGFMSFLIYKKHMSSEIGFVRKVLTVFEKYNINVEHTPTGIDLLSVVVLEEQANKYIHTIIAEIESSLGAKVTIERGIALIAIVGRNMANKSGVCAKVFGIFGDNDINIKIIAQSPDEINIIVGIDNSNYEKAIKCLYEGLTQKGLL